MSKSFFLGTSSEFLRMILEKGESAIIRPEDLILSSDTLFFRLDVEIKSKTHKDKLEFVKHINESFSKIFSEFTNSDTSVLKYQNELYRWSIYWKGVVEFKLNRKYPDFKFDPDLMWKFCSEQIKSSTSVKYLKYEYSRLLKVYKRRESSSDMIKDEILRMIKELEPLTEKQNQKEEKLREIKPEFKKPDPTVILCEELEINGIIKDSQNLGMTLQNGTGILEINDSISIERIGLLAKALIKNKLINKKDYITYKIKSVEYQMDQVIKAAEYDIQNNNKELKEFNEQLEKIFGRSKIGGRIKQDKQLDSTLDLPKLLTREETAKYLNITTTGLWKWTKAKKIKSIKKGHRVYYLKDEIIKFLQNE